MTLIWIWKEEKMHRKMTASLLGVEGSVSWNNGWRRTASTKTKVFSCTTRSHNMIWKINSPMEKGLNPKFSKLKNNIYSQFKQLRYLRCQQSTLLIQNTNKWPWEEDHVPEAHKGKDRTPKNNLSTSSLTKDLHRNPSKMVETIHKTLSRNHAVYKGQTLRSSNQKSKSSSTKSNIHGNSSRSTSSCRSSTTSCKAKWPNATEYVRSSENWLKYNTSECRDTSKVSRSQSLKRNSWRKSCPILQANPRISSRVPYLIWLEAEIAKIRLAKV